MNDQSGTYSDFGGKGSVAAAEIAIEEFNPSAKGIKVIDALTPGKRLFMISTGTGIAPFASLMRDRAEETWLVVDSSKYGQAGFVSFLPLSGITGVITDSGLPPEAAEAIQKHTQLCVV